MKDDKQDLAKIYLLMTATVNPLNCPGSKLFTPMERFGQYCDGLLYNVNLLCKRNLFDGIVFAENSGYDLSQFGALLPEDAKERVEFLSFPASEFNSARGKAYNELLLIDKSLERSKFLSGGGAS